jgi:hypothetical protein
MWTEEQRRIYRVDFGDGLALHQFAVDVKAAFLHLNFITGHTN